VQVDALEREGERGRRHVDEDAQGQHPELTGEGAKLQQEAFQTGRHALMLPESWWPAQPRYPRSVSRQVHHADRQAYLLHLGHVGRGVEHLGGEDPAPRKVDPTTCPSSSPLVSSVMSTPLSEEGIGSPRFLTNPLDKHAVDYDPGGVSTISPVTMASLLPSVFLITWARSTT